MSTKKVLLTVVTLLLTLLLANAATNVIVTKYAVDKNEIKTGDDFTLTISFKHIGTETLGSNLTLVNTSPADFALADGGSSVKITNPPILFSAEMELECRAENNVFSFDIIDDATGETIASDKVVIKEIVASDDDNQPQPPLDSTKLKPHFELVNQPFSEPFVSSKKYSLIIQLKNASSVIAKDVNLRLEKGGDELPFDLSSSTLTASQPQVLYQNNAKFVIDFELDPTVISKRYDLVLNLEYKNLHGDSFTQSFPVVVEVDNSNILPFIDIVDTQVSGSGETKNVQLTLANGGTLTAQNLQIVLSGFSANGLTLASDFSTKQIGNIGGGQQATVDFNIKAMPQAEGVQSLTATLTYGDSAGQQHSVEREVFVDSGFAGLMQAIDVKFEREQYYLAAGNSTEVVVYLTNRSEQDFENLKLNVQADGLQMMSTYIKLIENLKAGESKSYSFAVSANKGTAKNTYPISAEVTTSGNETTKVNAISGITVDDEQVAEMGKPKVIIDSYDYGGDYIMAGEAFPLTINFKNTSATTGIQNVKASYLSDDNVFIPVDSSNAVFIERIGSGEVVTKTVMVKTKNDAAAKTYVLEFTIAYEDEKGNAYDAKDNPYEEKERISINLKQQNRLEIAQIDLPPMIMVGEPVNIDVNFFNMGKSTMYNLLVSAEGDFEMRDATSYVGTFEPGKSEYYSATLIPQQPGELKGKISFSFEDSNGEKDVIEKELVLNVVEGGGWEGEDKFPGEMGPGDDMYPDDNMDMTGEGNGLWGYLKIAAYILIPLLIIVVIIILVKRRNRKRKESLLEIDDEAN